MLAQGSQHLPFSQIVPLSQQSSQFRPQLGSGAQKSSHFTTHTVCLTSFISHTTLQYFSQQAWQPQFAQQFGSPQVCTSVQVPGAGALPASSAIAQLIIIKPIASDNVYVFKAFSL
jgi:hypothetical protein